MTLSVLGFATLAAFVSPSPSQTTGTMVWFGDRSHSSVVLSVSRLLASPITATIPIASARVLTGRTEFTPVAIEARLNASALRSDDARRDEELRGTQFFDVARYPVIRFAGDRVTPTGRDSFRIEGALTIRGITHLLTLDTKLAGRQRDGRGRELARYEARGHFRRSEFGMTYGDGIVSDDVALHVVLETAAPLPTDTRVPPARRK